MGADVNVAVIGAGQAGLATSWHLTQAGVDHVILEAGRVGETWRSRRWDSFCLVTPNWTAYNLPGSKAGSDRDGFMSRGELVAYFQDWARSFSAPVKESCTVSALDADGNEFVLSVPSGKLRAHSVVVASGGYQRAYRPAQADQIPKGVTQLLAEEYRDPAALTPGAVLIIGSGQTGCQIAEELHEAGRRVFLACGRAPWAPRRMGGRDLLWWLVESGFGDRTLEMLPSPAARLLSNPQATGRGGGHDLHFRTLHAMGVELLGRYEGAGDGTIHFSDDLAQIVDQSDTLSGLFKKYVDALCEKRGFPIPWELPAPMRIKTRTELDVARDDITAVIWTCGYRPDYRWVHFPVFDQMGFPVQKNGASAVPGLYFVGVHFMRRALSATLYGVGEDAEIVARDIAENRR